MVPKSEARHASGEGRLALMAAEDKGRIVAESYSPEEWYRKSRVGTIITPQHLFAWRKAARAGRLALPAEQPPMFVPVAPSIREVSAAGASANGPTSIVVEIAAAVVRAERGVDFGWLRDVAAGREAGDVITVPAGMRVLVATKPVDFRRGAYSLVVKQHIEPELDPVFLADSYGYRLRKSALDAVGVTRCCPGCFWHSRISSRIFW
jgi:transposase